MLFLDYYYLNITELIYSIPNIIPDGECRHEFSEVFTPIQ